MKLLHGTVLAGGAVAAVLVVLVACSDKTPTTPVASATPSPIAVTTPTPSPSPTLVPQCNADQMPDCAAACCFEDDDNGLYEDELKVAMAEVKKNKPDLFDDDGSLAVNPNVYTDAVAEVIRNKYGFCARGGDRPGPPVGHSISEDEVAIKRDNRMSQNTDIVVGSLGNVPGIVRIFTCRPASF